MDKFSVEKSGAANPAVGLKNFFSPEVREIFWGPHTPLQNG
jgi:hypothetical protein